MSRIRSKDTKPEMLVRKFLHKNGFRYRLHVKNMPGKPDIVLPKYKTVIFIHGCFWHGHEGCKYYVVPKSNVSYWVPKIEKNIQRDVESEKRLEIQKWKIIKLWECDVKYRTESTLTELIKQIIKSQ